ncbi:Dehydrogenase/reductase SDR member 12, partial [Blyttiomyces sp. JEL0837]
MGSMFESVAVLYRASLFSVGGYKDFSKYGFIANSAKFTPGALDVDLKGRVAIVTGANNGLGKSVALELAKRGATVHMLCRDETRGKAARDEIINESKNENVILQIVDISRPSQLKSFVERFEASSSSTTVKGPVNILVNNAGILPSERSETPDGIESTFATNTLGGFYLTELLVPMLEKSDDPRVINVASGGMYNKKLDVTDLHFTKGKFDGTLAYAQTKRQQVELTEHWARKYPKIRFYSMHP